MTVTDLASFPPFEKWDDWTELDADAWPKRKERKYTLVPTTCFNCEAACGLVAYVDKETQQVARVEGNPYHAGSRGKNCAKGPATQSQIDDPGRILYPMKRVGKRGSGEFERTTWDEVLDTFAAKIRTELQAERRDRIIYHVGRPGHDGYMDRVLRSWGVDGHNSHTNVCSSAARLGYATWSGADRPSPDHENAKFMLLISAHLETGHYFNPHAQRIVEGAARGAKLCVIDVRLSNTASRADWWLAPWPGTEALLLLSMAQVLLSEDLFDATFLEEWVNWREFLTALHPDDPATFAQFVTRLKGHYNEYTPESTADETGIEADTVREIAREIGKAGSALAAHVWRSAAAGNLGGWQVARCLQFLVVLMGGVDAEGGTHLNSSNKFVPAPFLQPPKQRVWNELLYPPEYPLAYHEMSFLMPHLMRDSGQSIAAYFTRVYNPVWTNPDGLMWEELLRDESKIELHGALTPTWNETAQYADYVLPVGLATERHDLMSTETHAAKWLGFRQPVTRVARERAGETFTHTHETNPGEVWEEDEFWIELSWRIDPDGELGIRQWYESPYRPGEKITIKEYYQWIFENTVPGLPEEAAKKGMDPLEYMQRHGAFLVEDNVYSGHEKPLDESVVKDDATETGEDGTVRHNGKPVGIMVGGKARRGFGTPSRRLEIYSDTMAKWGWPEHTLPGYIESHVNRRFLDREQGQFVLIPTFRLPTLIHTRSANAKWLYELSNTNPLWVHPEDAEKIGLKMAGLVRVSTAIGHFVNRVWVTEGIRPGVVACSHHLGRWRLNDATGTDRWGSAKVKHETLPDGTVRFRRTENIGPFDSTDPDSQRVWWTDGGVHQNLTFPVQPDPISGMHCWHQRVTVTPPQYDDHYGDVCVDPTRSMQIYHDWKAKTHPAPGPGNLRRPLWFARAVRPADETYTMDPK